MHLSKGSCNSMLQKSIQYEHVITHAIARCNYTTCNSNMQLNFVEVDSQFFYCIKGAHISINSFSDTPNKKKYNV